MNENNNNNNHAAAIIYPYTRQPSGGVVVATLAAILYIYTRLVVMVTPLLAAIIYLYTRIATSNNLHAQLSYILQRFQAIFPVNKKEGEARARLSYTLQCFQAKLPSGNTNTVSRARVLYILQCFQLQSFLSIRMIPGRHRYTRYIKQLTNSVCAQRVYYISYIKVSISLLYKKMVLTFTKSFFSAYLYTHSLFYKPLHSWLKVFTFTKVATLT